MKLLVTDSAKQDLKGIQEYYAEQDVPEVANKIINQLLNQAKRLLDHPESGRIVPEFNDTDIRELISPPYRVVYLRDEAAISIIRVWRSERVLELP
jgi:toxin ParE1/3/4